MKKILMQTPIVEMDGDEMTRILWADIKKELIEPFVELFTEYYDLGLKNRDATDDEVTVTAANAIKKHKVGVKCATITPNDARLAEYNLKRLYKSPNGTIRSILDGTVFREPIIANGIQPYIPGWKKPVIIARHAFGDIYSDTEAVVSAGQKADLIISDNGKNIKQSKVAEFKGDGVVLSYFNTDESIASFARSCFNYALSKKMDFWFGAKDTISKIYDGRFKDIFHEIFDNEYKSAFETVGIEFFYSLIDDIVARVVKSQGGMIWGCKNYDGDVMSDMVATAFGSLAMMSSVLVSPDGCYEFEAAHGTVTRHYYDHLKGKETSTNPIATIFAWTGALAKNGALTDNLQLVNFAKALEKASLTTIESGIMTKDLLPLFSAAGITPKAVNSAEFIKTIRKNLESALIN